MNWTKTASGWDEIRKETAVIFSTNGNWWVAGGTNGEGVGIYNTTKLLKYNSKQGRYVCIQ